MYPLDKQSQCFIHKQGKNFMCNICQMNPSSYNLLEIAFHKVYQVSLNSVIHKIKRFLRNYGDRKVAYVS